MHGWGGCSSEYRGAAKTLFALVLAGCGVASVSPTALAAPSPPTTMQPRPGVLPLDIEVSKVRCPSRTVTVTVRNDGQRTEEYGVLRDSVIFDWNALAPARSAETMIRLREDRGATISVLWRGNTYGAEEIVANCTRKKRMAAAPPPLPDTGPFHGVYAKLATGAALLLAGLVLWWYGSLWPTPATPLRSGHESTRGLRGSSPGLTEASGPR